MLMPEGRTRLRNKCMVEKGDFHLVLLGWFVRADEPSAFAIRHALGRSTDPDSVFAMLRVGSLDPDPEAEFAKAMLAEERASRAVAAAEWLLAGNPLPVWLDKEHMARHEFRRLLLATSAPISTIRHDLKPEDVVKLLERPGTTTVIDADDAVVQELERIVGDREKAGLDAASRVKDQLRV